MTAQRGLVAPEPDWARVVNHLATMEASYAAIDSPGAFVREHVLRPLRDRYNRGERTAALAAEILAVE